MMRFAKPLTLALLAGGIAGPAAALDYVNPPFYDEYVETTELPPVEERLPDNPLVVDLEAQGLKSGRHGGVLKMAMTKAKETRQMVVYGYARLVKYNRDFTLETDILERVDVDEGRIFTLHLRKGHKWSDGAPFTSEDFRYWWEDIAHNEELSPVGPPASLRVNGDLPVVEFPDSHTVRYSWPQPNPTFLPQLAKASPRYIYAPAHYLKQFHPTYQTPEKLAELIEQKRAKNWSALHNKLSKAYKNTNSKLPTLQPWKLVTDSTSGNRFAFERNAFYHKVDTNGLQLPYIDRWIFNKSDGNLIALKAATGEVDLQGRHLKFDDTALLRKNQKEHGQTTHLWQNGKGAHAALFPNLNHKDPVWRDLLRDVRFRRALSLAINRYEINRVMYFGMALEGQNTLLPESPLYREDYRTRWTGFDLGQANSLLDDIGLTARDERGIRLMPNGEPLEIIIESAAGGTEQADILQLITDSWAKVDIKLHIKPTSMDVLKPRIFAGETVMTIFSGWENGMAHAGMEPSDQAPVSQEQFQWPRWGQYLETGGKSGEKPDLPEARELYELHEKWFSASSHAEREAIWQRMLEIHAENLFTIGIISGTKQPVVVRNGLMNVPEEAIWNWNPGAHFGVYGTDLFWFDEGAKTN